MSKSFETQMNMGMQQEGESDELKRVFLEGNPYLLVGAPCYCRTSFCCAAPLALCNMSIGGWPWTCNLQGINDRLPAPLP